MATNQASAANCLDRRGVRIADDITTPAVVHLADTANHRA